MAREPSHGTAGAELVLFIYYKIVHPVQDRQNGQSVTVVYRLQFKLSKCYCYCAGRMAAFKLGQHIISSFTDGAERDHHR